MKKEITNYSLLNGLYAGLIQGIFYFICYFFNRSLFASFWVGILTILFAMIYPIYVANRYKKRNENILTLRDGFSMLFIISFLRGIIASIVFLIIFKLIDPDLSVFIKDKIIENTAKMLQGFGTSEDKINEAIEKIRNQPDQFTYSKQLYGILISIPIIGVFSILCAAIIRKDPPVFSEPSN